MKLTLKAKLINVYNSNEYKDKETGKVTKSKPKLQLLTIKTMQNGSKKNELLDISIPKEKFLTYKDKIGKEVEVDVAVIGDVIFYGV